MVTVFRVWSPPDVHHTVELSSVGSYIPAGKQQPDASGASVDVIYTRDISPLSLPNKSECS